MSEGVTLYLHPGHSKTGTTAIQNFLFNNRRLLRKQRIGIVNHLMTIAGTWFPQKGQRPPVGWVEETYRTSNHEKEHATFVRLKQTAVALGIRRLVLSAENLCNLLDREEGRRLHEIIAQVFEKVKLIYYIRRQDEYYLSSWQQWGHKLGMSLEEFVDHRLSISKPDYLSNCRVYKQLYGADSLSVIPFSPSFFFEQDLISDFTHRLGVSFTDGFRRGVDENRGLNLALCRVLSALPHRYRDQHDQRIKGKLQKLVQNGVLFKKDRTFLTVSLRRRIMDHFKENNGILCDEYLPGCSLEKYFAVKGEEETEVDVLKREVRELREVAAIQMDLLLELLK